MTPQQIAAAAQLRLDMNRMHQLQQRAERGAALSVVERLALADWLREAQPEAVAGSSGGDTTGVGSIPTSAAAAPDPPPKVVDASGRARQGVRP